MMAFDKDAKKVSIALLEMTRLWIALFAAVLLNNLVFYFLEPFAFQRFASIPIIVNLVYTTYTGIRIYQVLNESFRYSVKNSFKFFSWFGFRRSSMLVLGSAAYYETELIN